VVPWPLRAHELRIPGRRRSPGAPYLARQARRLLAAYAWDINDIAEQPAAASSEGSALEAARFRILAVDDEASFLRGVARMLAPRGFDLVAHDQADAALAYLKAERAVVDVMLIDRKLAHGIDGFDVLTRARSIAPDVSLIMLTGDLHDSTAATALRLGAFHFITKPIDDIEAVTLTLLRAAHFSRLQRRTRSLEWRIGLDQQFETLVGNSPAMRALYLRMAKVAVTDLNVLIHGESGTGKELAARAIHNRSARSRGPFVALNCGAIPEALIDSELFGHTRGAFTGAAQARPGVFVEAHGGTLLLDEIGELTATSQTRLLRVLQEREVRVIGGSGARQVDVRVIAATHVDLDDLLRSKQFRPDLFYRLNVVALQLPPLRDRVEDIPLLVTHLVEKHAALLRRPVPRLSHALVHALMRHPWPGNVRELENIIQSTLALNSAHHLDVDALPPPFELPPGIPLVEATTEAAPGSGARDVRGGRDRPLADLDDYKSARRRSIEAFDHTYFVALLERIGTNLSEGSRISGMDRSNLRRALSKAGLRSDRPHGRTD
jgi:two-component system response regulator AtoC